jgi:alpha-1,4-digalacturonate transport system substrate-binding protein
MSLRLNLAALAVAAGTALAAHPAAAADIRITCYSDGTECPAQKEMSAQFMKENPDINVVIDEVPYSAILQSLPVQLAAGNGPDIARTTAFGTIQQYFLDIRPYIKDADYWDKNFGKLLPWLRSGPQDKGIYGLPTQLTVTGAIVDKSLFEQANVPLPGPTATWDDWAAAVEKVAKATKTPHGMAWDRSGHRFAGPAISNGAKYFKPDGTPDVVDDGFKTMAAKFVKWNQDGTVDKDVWVASGGGYRDAFSEFQNGQIVLYLSGSWQLRRLENQIATAFDWAVVGDPCGPAACSGMPGGAIFVAFKQTKNPEAVARYLDWFAQPAHYAELMAKTANIPAQEDLQTNGSVKYNLTPAGNAAMAAFVNAATKLSPIAYQLQGYKYNFQIFTPTVDRLSQVIAGQITLDQAYARITQDVADALATANKK